MFQHSRHFIPTFRAWELTDARRAITEITDDAMSNVHATNLWSAHPMDDGVRDGNGTLYFGAAGVVWALDYLRRVQAINYGQDLAPLLEIALSRNAPWFAGTAYSRHASLLMGDLGILLVQMRIAPDPGVADELCCKRLVCSLNSRWAATAHSGHRNCMVGGSAGWDQCTGLRVTCCRFSVAGIG